MSYNNNKRLHLHVNVNVCVFLSLNQRCAHAHVSVEVVIGKRGGVLLRKEARWWEKVSFAGHYGCLQKLLLRSSLHPSTTALSSSKYNTQPLS